MKNSRTSSCKQAAGNPSGCGCQRKRISSNLALRYLRKSKVPEEGWNNTNFHSAKGRALLNDLLVIHRKASLDGIRAMTRFLKPKFNEIIERMIQEVYERKERRGERLKSYGRKAEFIFNPQGDETLWASAIEDVMGEFDREITVQVVPMMQGTATSVYKKTSLLLGTDIPQDVGQRILSSIRPIATKVRGINATTREQLQRIVGEGLDRELPVNEVARHIRDRSNIITSRIPTIARTEMGRSADLGRAMSLKESGVVKTVEVIGCQAIEPSSPTYRGVPTCNIKGVPVGDSDTLQFHPNHTGTIVPEMFFDDEGDDQGPRRPDEPVPDLGEGLTSAHHSLNAHMTEKGELTTDRLRLHDDIVHNALNPIAPNPPSQKPILHMTGGGPASGKSRVLKKDVMPDEALKVDPDSLKKEIPEYNQLVGEGNTLAANYAHEESSHLSKRILSEAADENKNVIYDTTGDSGVAKLRSKVEKYRKSGASVRADYVTITIEEAVNREAARAAKTGRKVPLEYMTQCHQNISRVVPAGLDEGWFDELRVWDNEVAFGDPMILIMEQKEGKTTIHRPDLWERFLRKNPDYKHKFTPELDG